MLERVFLNTRSEVQVPVGSGKNVIYSMFEMHKEMGIELRRFTLPIHKMMTAVEVDTLPTTIVLDEDGLEANPATSRCIHCNKLHFVLHARAYPICDTRLNRGETLDCAFVIGIATEVGATIHPRCSFINDLRFRPKRNPMGDEPNIVDHQYCLDLDIPDLEVQCDRCRGWNIVFVQTACIHSRIDVQINRNWMFVRGFSYLRGDNVLLMRNAGYCYARILWHLPCTATLSS